MTDESLLQVLFGHASKRTVTDFPSNLVISKLIGIPTSLVALAVAVTMPVLLASPVSHMKILYVTPSLSAAFAALANCTEALKVELPMTSRVVSISIHV